MFEDEPLLEDVPPEFDMGNPPAPTRVKNEKTYAVNANNLIIILVSIELFIYS